MNSLAHVLTQKIANDFLQDRDAVALGNANHTLLVQLLGSQYRMKGGVSYQVMTDRAGGCARLCEMSAKFTAQPFFDDTSVFGTVAISQSLPFTPLPHMQDKGDLIEKAITLCPPPPYSLAFQRVDTDINTDTDKHNKNADSHPNSSSFSSSSSSSFSYRIGSINHIRLARSINTLSILTEITSEKYEGLVCDSVNEEYYTYYNTPDDDGRVGRPELAHFNFLPSTIRQLEISSTILLSSHVSMSTLRHVESLTLGALWSWQLTPIAASSYWPPQLKQLKLKRWFHVSDEEAQDDVSKRQFFSEIDVSKIIFPSTLTELELPKRMYELLNEEESKQLSTIQYPSGLIKLIRPFIPHRLVGWHLPQSLIHLECDFNLNVNDLDISQWELPSWLLTLTFSDGPDEQFINEVLSQNLSALRLPPYLTSIKFPFKYDQPLESMVLPTTLIEFNFQGSTFPLDWHHTQLSSFTVYPPPRQQPLASFSLPSTVTRIEFALCKYLPHVPKDYQWPPHLNEVKLESLFQAPVKDPTTMVDVEFILPPTLRRLILHHGSYCTKDSFNQLKLPDQLESIEIHADGTIEVLTSLAQLPSTLKEFIYHAPSAPLPSFTHTQLVKLELIGWNHSSFTCPGEFILPPTLQSLSFDDPFDQHLYQLRLPVGLTELRFGESFSQSLAPLAEQMPPKLRVLSLGVVITPTKNNTSFTHLSSLMDLALPLSLREILLPSPTIRGIVLSPLHTRYTDFVRRLKLQRDIVVTPLASYQKLHKFI